MKRRQKGWFFLPPKPPKPKVPENIKTEVESKANELIDSFLKPTYIKPPPEDYQFSYIVDFYAKWYRNYFHFNAKYCCSAPNCIAPFFESKFARMEYAGNDLFSLSYMRHTGQWLELFTDLSIDECLETIKNDPHFMP
ncbi:MAG TPA: hypothetical protein VIO58_10025 [Candidatus Methanoperedens sp.]